MKYQIENKFPNDFFKKQKSPLISIYQNTATISTYNKQDSLVFKNVVKNIENDLLINHSKKTIEPLMLLLNKLIDDTMFWSKTLDGIALFASLDKCIIYNLRHSPETFYSVSNSFHTKPLIKYNQLIKTYHVLGINGRSYQVYEGNKYGLKKLDLGSFSNNTLKDLLGSDYTESYMTHGTYGSSGSSRKQSTYHGHGSKETEVALDLEKFFRKTDKIVDSKISKKYKLPLILLTLKEHQSVFFKVSNNDYLINETIVGNYEMVEEEAVIKRIRAITKKDFKENVNKLVKTYNNLKAKKQSSDHLNEIVKGAIDGRIATLFIEENKIIEGIINIEKKKVITSNKQTSYSNDVLNDLIQLSYEINAEVIILKTEMMPTEKGVAAIFRY